MRKFPHFLLVSLFSLSIFIALPGFAQSDRGILTGTVTDSAGGSLQGAQITIEPGDVTAVTNPQGSFTVAALPSGEYTVTITYAGFETLIQKATMKAGQTAHADTVLKVASTHQEVDVYAGRQGGEVEAINRTFTADNIINVIPADVITSLPNANIADAVGRLPSVSLERDEGEGKYVQVRGTEPRLTHTTLDGVTIASPETVRQIKLDLIPADLVESVQINKTLQADIEGDGIGGSVDLRTKSAGDKPTISLEALDGYTPIIGGRTAYQFDGTAGKRFLPGSKLGVILSGSYDFNGRGINDIEPGPAVAGTYDLRDYQYYRDRRGFAGTIDYRLSDTSNIMLKGLYSHLDNFGDDWIYSPAINTFISDTQGGTDGTTSFSALKRRPVQDIGGLQLGGRHLLQRSLFAWDLDSSVGRTRDAGYSSARFSPQDSANPLNNIQYSLDLTNPLKPHLNVQNGVDIFDTTHYFYTGQQVQYYYNPEVDLGLGGSMSTPYTLAGHSSTFEFGGRFRNEHKFVNQDTRNFKPTAASANPEDPSLALSNFLSDFKDPKYYGGSYQFGSGVDYRKVSAFAGQTQTSAVLGNAFNQIEKVSAGYAMNTINLGRFRLVTGLRIERTSEDNLGHLGARNATGVGATSIRATGSYTDPLPSVSLRYALTPASGLRVVYGRGLARPNFSDLVPFRTAPSGGTARNTVSQGNPKLKAEYADNFDLLYENSLPGTGLLQAGFFYKHLSNPIVATQTLLPPDPTVTGNSNPYYLNQTINAGSAYLYGFEIAYQQHFNSLPGAFNGLGLSTNYGYTASQATLPPYIPNAALQTGQISGPNRGAGGSTPPLLRQAPNTFNVSPTYDKRGLSLRLGATYNEANIYSYGYNDSNAGPITPGGGGGGLHGPNGDTYLYSHLQLDLQGTYKLPKGFTLVGYALNMNNEVFGFYQGSSQFPIQREFYRQTYGGGLRWSPREK